MSVNDCIWHSPYATWQCLIRMNWTAKAKNWQICCNKRNLDESRAINVNPKTSQRRHRKYVYRPTSPSLSQQGKLTDLSHPSPPSYTPLASIRCNFLKKRYYSCRIQRSRLDTMHIVIINIISVNYQQTTVLNMMPQADSCLRTSKRICTHILPTK